MVSRRLVLQGLSAGCVTWAISPGAQASSARALSLRDLVQQSRHAVVASALEAHSEWEQYAGARRIVTFTRLIKDQSVDGRPLGQKEVVVRTLGGTVGHIGQIVHGEARFVPSRPALVFLVEDTGQLWRVMGMAQGHYPIQNDNNGVQRLIASPNLPELLNWERAATRILPGLSIVEAERLVAREMSAPPKPQ